MNRSSVLSRAHAAAVATAAALVVMIAACGDDGRGEEAGSQDPPTTAAPTSTTQPSATEDEEAAFEAVREVYEEREQLMYELFQDPSLLEAADGDYVGRLMELVTDNMAHTVDTNVGFAERLAADGHRLQAAGDVLIDSGVYRMETADADTITFEVCSIEDSVEIDEAGEAVPDTNIVAGNFGAGTARRIDGVWKLHELVRDTDMDLTEQDRSPGTLYVGACDDEFGEGEEEEAE